ncbi:hypothetical protein HRG_011194 [Hirsutella rhossiliensis]|uniref:MULE transposase domain-containing protein n=1 Tax=Hirsutella rhossiliensis TaxID=111463 RepID=A0A9P8MJX3_9HYPO|nr:uncharacterized protein HRG_11194 [Hirsutella rhossiliensis]KAH0957703.1 hypothetical protein HRG_11194 [Hirsutella rhossiliensis]
MPRLLRHFGMISKIKATSLTLQKQDFRKAKRKAATIRCQYSGSYRSWEENEGKYKTSTKKSGCLFYSNIRFHQPSQSYRVTFKVNSHCHEPLFAPAASALIRQRSQRKFGIERLYRLVETYSSNAANMRKDIAEATQRDHPEVLINDRDVGYIQRQLRLQRYGATTSTQAFLDVLLAAKADGEVAFFAVDRGPNGKIWRIFWIYSDCLADWKRNPELLIMDNTYLVNRFNQCS